MLEWQDDVKSSAHFLIIFSHLNFVNTFCWATPGSGLPEYWAGPGSVCLLAYWHHNGVKSFPKKSQIPVRNTNTKSNCPKSFLLFTKNWIVTLQSSLEKIEIRLNFHHLLSRLVLWSNYLPIRPIWQVFGSDVCPYIDKEIQGTIALRLETRLRKYIMKNNCRGWKYEWHFRNDFITLWALLS